MPICHNFLGEGGGFRIGGAAPQKLRTTNLNNTTSGDSPESASSNKTPSSAVSLQEQLQMAFKNKALKKTTGMREVKKSAIFCTHT